MLFCPVVDQLKCDITGFDLNIHIVNSLRPSDAYMRQ